MATQEKFLFYQDVEDQNEPLPKHENESYQGPFRDYPEKPLWFESKGLGGKYTPYQIVRGNGDSNFDIDAFINSEMGELVIRRARYEFVDVGMYNHGSGFMINYWRERGIILEDFEADDKPHEWLVYSPDYIFAEENSDKKYPVMFSCHGGGGTLFEATNHGFVELAHEKGLIVICPECENMDRYACVELFPTYIKILEKKGYPIDRSRIYMSGMSNGGGATIFTSVANSNFITAGAAHSSPGRLDSTSPETLIPPLFKGKMRMKIPRTQPELTQSFLDNCSGVPFYMHVGSCDMLYLPFGEERINGINLYLKVLDCPSQTRATTDNILGITADLIEQKTIDGSTHTFARFYNRKGQEVLTYVGIEGLPHWVSFSFARMAWDFLSRFHFDENGVRCCSD